MTPLIRLGLLLTRERTAAGWSQLDLAERAKLHHATIGCLERGEVDQPRRVLDLLWLCQASIMVLQYADHLARQIARDR
mgnify:CR=1 FL=1